MGEEDEVKSLKYYVGFVLDNMRQMLMHDDEIFAAFEKDYNEEQRAEYSVGILDETGKKVIGRLIMTEEEDVVESEEDVVNEEKSEEEVKEK